MPQLFGEIRTPTATYHAMFCQDTDQPDSAVISWWHSGVEAKSAAALVRLVPNGAVDTFRLKLVTYFQVDTHGGLIAPSLSPPQRAEYSAYEVVLRRQRGSYTGTWTHPRHSCDGGEIFFPNVNFEYDEFWKVEQCADWDHFKRWASTIRQTDRTAAFRGQGSNKFRLESTIHRHGRTRLERYYHETLSEFKNHAEAVLGMTFDLDSSIDYGTLLGLAQHHGLPTPLLDFTDSPYIAAYFAFSDAVEFQRPKVTHVRVYALRGDYLAGIAHSHVVLATAAPYIASLSLSARHNPRLYAQQGRFLVTNISRLELWLRSQNRVHPVLVAADIPVECAATALEDLKYMGLTAGTLFPGLDGICKTMKQTMILNEKNHHQVQLSPTPAPSSLEGPTNASDKNDCV